MNKLLAMGGLGLGMVGVILTLVSGVWRVTGHYHLGGFETMTLFVGGMGLMLIGCFAKLYSR